MEKVACKYCGKLVKKGVTAGLGVLFPVSGSADNRICLDCLDWARNSIQDKLKEIKYICPDCGEVCDMYLHIDVSSVTEVTFKMFEGAWEKETRDNPRSVCPSIIKVMCGMSCTKCSYYSESADPGDMLTKEDCNKVDEFIEDFELEID